MKSTFKTQIKKFNELRLKELHDIYLFRQEIFIVEQECAYLDTDGFDPMAYHLFIKNDEGKVIAYSRLIPPAIQYEGFVAIGRVAVKREYRKKGWARKIMEESIHLAKKRYSGYAIKISAQCYLQKFYESMHFSVVGDSYLEDGIPHIAMIMKPRS